MRNLNEKWEQRTRDVFVICFIENWSEAHLTEQDLDREENNLLPPGLINKTREKENKQGSK